MQVQVDVAERRAMLIANPAIGVYRCGIVQTRTRSILAAERAQLGARILAPWAVPGQGRLMTVGELVRLPDDGWTDEVVEGRLVRMPLAGTAHGGYGAALLLSLGLYVRSQRLGRIFAAEAGFLLRRIDEPDTVLGADVAFVQTERVPARRSDQTFWRLAPDLIAEIASPNQYRPAWAAKVGGWQAVSVRLAWVVWPASRQVDLWQPGRATPVALLNASDTLDGLDVVPGFTVPVAQLFE